jgi:hypothetical protein
MNFSSHKLFGLVDMGQRRLEEAETIESRKGLVSGVISTIPVAPLFNIFRSERKYISTTQQFCFTGSDLAAGCNLCG